MEELVRLDRNGQEFKDLVAQHEKELAVAQMQDKMFMNLIHGGFTAPNMDLEAKSNEQILSSLEGLKSSLIPVTNFFSKINKPAKLASVQPTISHVKTEQEIFDELKDVQKAKIRASALARLAIKKKGV